MPNTVQHNTENTTAIQEFESILTSTPAGRKSARTTRGSSATSEVKIVISYPSRNVTKLIKSEFEAVNKALVYGEPSNVASTVMKCEEFRLECLESSS